MDPWSLLEQRALERHGVADVSLALEVGVTRSRFFARTAREGWAQPLRGIRLHPAARRTVQQGLLVVCRSSGGLAASAGETAAWLHGLQQRPPRVPWVVGEHARRCGSYGNVRRLRVRWLERRDVVHLDHVPVLEPCAMFLTLGHLSDRELWALLIDAVHRGLVSPDELVERVHQVGPIRGRARLLERSAALSRTRTESVFNDEVATELRRLGYGPGPTMRIETPDGVGLHVDVPLPAWKIAVEPEGDAFHHTREQRRTDRRRLAAYAGTAWVCVPIDWRDWHLDRGVVLRGIDDAIDQQRRRGIGADIPPPRGSLLTAR
jgi:hypothetical protein